MNTSAGAIAGLPPAGVGSRRALIALAVACAGAMIAGVVIGATRMSPGEAFAALLAPLGLGDAPASDVAVVWKLRLPRVALAAIAGAGLAVAGTGLQGLVRNPLADPGLLGIATGSACGAAAMMIFGAGLLAAAPAWAVPLALPIAAFVVAAAVTVIVVTIGQRRGTTGLVLAGIAINAIAAAVLGLMLFVADDAALRSFTFWTLGSVAGATRGVTLIALALVGVAVAGIWRQAGRLDTLALGDAEARHVGVDVRAVMRWTALWTAIAVGGVVAVAGPIGFIGLAVPHVVRAWIGPGHRALIPAAALGGAALLVLADTVARTVALPREVPIGVITALIGAPVLIRIALRRTEHA
jgi:iron complex transport system permease protein